MQLVGSGSADSLSAASRIYVRHAKVSFEGLKIRSAIGNGRQKMPPTPNPLKRGVGLAPLVDWICVL